MRTERVTPRIALALLLSLLFTIAPRVPTALAQADPVVAITSPSDQATLSRTVVVSGTAAATGRVGAVDVGFKNRQTDRWLQPNGTIRSARAFLPATLDSVGTRSTDWTITVDLPAGDWVAKARATNTSGRIGSERPTIRFAVDDSAVDVESAQTTIVAPAQGQTLTGPGVVLSGTATDNVGVADVRLVVRNTTTGQWLRADGTLGSWELLSATLESPDSGSTNWSFEASLPEGDYSIVARGIDAAGNEESNRPRALFTTENPQPTGNSTQAFVGNAALFHFVPAAITNQYTRQQAVEIARNHDLIVSHGRAFKRFIPAMKAANPNLIVLVYQKGSTVGSNQGNTYPNSWYLRDSAGDKVQSDPWNSYLMDIRKPGYRQVVADGCLAEQADSGYDGCYFDVMGLGALFITSTAPVLSPGGAEISKTQWHVMERDFTEWLDTNLPAGSERMSNGIGAGRLYFNPRFPSAELSEAMGSNHSEIWHRSAYEGANEFRSVSDYRNDLDMVVDAGNEGNQLLVTTKLWADNTRAQADQWRGFSYASFLLATDGSHYFAFTSKQDELEGQEAIYDLNIGTPRGSYDERASAVFVRRYTRGFVMVNAGSSAATVTLPAGRFVDADGNASRGTVRVSAHEGLVLRKTN